MSDDLRATVFERLPDYPMPLPDPARPEAAALPTRALGEIGRTPLERLSDTLDAMFEACSTYPEPSHSTFFAHTMRLALAEAAADPALLAPTQLEGSADSYRRHLLFADPHDRYAIAALVWQPGQASPVHAHHTWCGYAVVDGELSETIFGWDDAQQCASVLRAQTRKRGAVSFVRGGRAAIHRLGNCSDVPAVSLHIYGVDGARIGTHVNDIVHVADTAELV
ncbi:cysteine dioxygenase type I [Burkholderia sp. H160]|nr:cysteine dioxygenase type I [Burkholderia sp. H160]